MICDFGESDRIVLLFYCYFKFFYNIPEMYVKSLNVGYTHYKTSDQTETTIVFNKL